MPLKIPHTWDKEQLQRGRLERLQTAMKRFGVGALYLSGPADLRYVLNVRVRSSKAFVPVEGRPIAVVRPRDTGYVKTESPNVELLPQSNRSDPTRSRLSVEAIKDLMAQQRVADLLLGLDDIDSSSIRPFMESGIAVTDAGPVLEAARSVKTDDEIGLYRNVAIQYVHTIKAFRETVRPGTTEQELASAVAAAWYKAGGEEIVELEVCSGERINPWQRWPTPRRVCAGEFVTVDFHGRGCGGLIGDLSRTYFVGDRPSTEQRDLYKRAHEYLLETTRILRAGRSIAEVLESVPTVPEKYAVQLYHYDIAHSVGVLWAGYPEVNKTQRLAKGVLEPNHVLAVESYFGEQGSSLGVKLERMVVIRDGEPEVLDSEVSLDDWLLC